AGTALGAEQRGGAGERHVEGDADRLPAAGLGRGAAARGRLARRAAPRLALARCAPCQPGAGQPGRGETAQSEQAATRDRGARQILTRLLTLALAHGATSLNAADSEPPAHGLRRRLLP